MQDKRLGSLFDGSGGFPLAASLCGIEPVWASEVEPYPIAVTRSRFPTMKHLGDISKVNGAEIEPVDVITFGSPCQDLSVAGKRAGLKHEANGDDETTRSGLFMEAVRIIKEMREATNGKYPTFALWENVPGAFSSNKGEDFRIVLEELIKIVEPTAVMPTVPKKGWAYADSYVGDGWSIAYRVFDAQYWGVPQRRRRIHLVLDLRGDRAGKVLFEREGVRGYFAQGGTPWQGAAGDAESGAGADDREGEGTGIGREQEVAAVGADIYNLATTGDVACSLTAGGNTSTGTCPKVLIPYTLKSRGEGADDGEENRVSVLTPWDSQGNQVHDGTGDNVYSTLRGCGGAGYQAGYVLAESGGADDREGVGIINAIGGNAENYQISDSLPTLTNGNAPGFMNAVCYGVTTKGNGDTFISEERHTSLSTGGGQAGQGYPCAMVPNTIAVDQGGGKSGANYYEELAPTLTCTHGGEPAVAYALDQQGGKGGANYAEEVMPTLCSDSHGTPHAVAYPMPYTLKIRSGCEGGGKGALIQTNMSATLATNNDQYLFQPYVAVPNILLDDQGGSQISVRADGKSPTLRAEMHGNVPCVMSVENHPADSRVNLDKSGKVQTLTSRMGTGGGNVPMVMEPVTYGMETFHCTSEEEKSPTLKARDWKDPHVVAYWDGTQTCGTLTANNAGGNQRMPDKDNFNCVIQANEQSIAIDRAICEEGIHPIHEEVHEFIADNNADAPHQQDLLQATDGVARTIACGTHASGSHLTKTVINLGVRYIVRRLTPIECARLQGFADQWGDIEQKHKFTEEEYQFWLEVRNTHAAINGKVVKDYTKKQMLTWYNKLHTDSAEYKMWGNGIALPPALYCMQGIKDALEGR